MQQSVKSNSFKKFKAIASVAHTWPIFQILRKSSKPGLGNLVQSNQEIRKGRNYNIHNKKYKK